MSISPGSDDPKGRSHLFRFVGGRLSITCYEGRALFMRLAGAVSFPW